MRLMLRIYLRSQSHLNLRYPQFLGGSVRYIKDDHVEVGTLVSVDMSNPLVPAKFDNEFKDGRKVQATRENLEWSETPDACDIPTKTRNIIEVATSLSKET